MNIEAVIIDKDGLVDCPFRECGFYCAWGGKCCESDDLQRIPDNCPNRHGFTSNEVLKKLVEKWELAIDDIGVSKLVRSWLANCVDELEVAMEGGSNEQG